jgi:hypothetical protein
MKPPVFNLIQFQEMWITLQPGSQLVFDQPLSYFDTDQFLTGFVPEAVFVYIDLNS